MTNGARHSLCEARFLQEGGRGGVWISVLFIFGRLLRGHSAVTVSDRKRSRQMFENLLRVTETIALRRTIDTLVPGNFSFRICGRRDSEAGRCAPNFGIRAQFCGHRHWPGAHEEPAGSELSSERKRTQNKAGTR